MPGVIVHYRVANFEAFVKVFEKNAGLRQAAGMHHTVLSQAVGDPNHVYIFVEGDDMAKLRMFDSSEELQETLKVGGVITPPQVQFLDKVRSYPH